MTEDIRVSELDVVKAYNSQLRSFKNAASVCGADIDVQLRKIRNKVSSTSDDVKSCQHSAKMYRDEIVGRYKPVRKGHLLFSEDVGDDDHTISSQYQALESLSNDLQQRLSSINSLIDEIGQETKNFCLELNNLVDASTQKIGGMIELMSEMKKLKR